MIKILIKLILTKKKLKGNKKIINKNKKIPFSKQKMKIKNLIPIPQ